MKKLHNLPKDIYSLFEKGHEPSEENLEQLAKEITYSVKRQLAPYKEGDSALRMSMLGKKCKRQVWYMQHAKEHAEPLLGKTKIKFLFGDMLEALLKFFTKEAGYSLTGEQEKLNIEGVEGHRDGVIEGTTVDFKSASSFSFKKFEQPNGLLEDDPFGYLHQLAAYTEADKTAEVKDQEAAFVAIDKQNGDIAVATYKTRHLPNVKEKIREFKEVLKLDKEPIRDFEAIPEGKSGNERLGTYCSYCPFKFHCWMDANDGAGLRTFLYANKPLFLTNVAVLPKVREIKKGEIIDTENVG